ncbi:MAG: multiheme c-type cytochrome [Alphaproteobacteria bacterium]
MFATVRSMRPFIFVRSIVVTTMLIAAISGCFPIAAPPDDGDSDGYNNTTDPDNNGAWHIGSSACGSCHQNLALSHQLHGHSHALNGIEGVAPPYPAEGDRAGVPAPPDGFDWADIAYVVGGYTRNANFIDLDGYLLTTGLERVPTQWNQAFPPNGTTPGFADYEPTAEAPIPYDYSCFQCHTTDARPQNEGFPTYQENRPGLIGAWHEAGVQCEACHGPGSNHVSNPSARDLFVGNSADNCGKCHTRGADPEKITANEGYILNYSQYPELRASGGHSEFACVTCHDPHAGTNYDRENAIRNECAACHSDHNMAIHEGLTFVRGDYSEELSCVSCHMPFATRSTTAATTDVVGGMGRMGDTRTHIFRINTEPVNYQAFFTSDGTDVTRNSTGEAAVTMDFVCFRCHSGIGNAGVIDSLELASGVASGMHSITRPPGKQRGQ